MQAADVEESQEDVHYNEKAKQEEVQQGVDYNEEAKQEEVQQGVDYNEEATHQRIEDLCQCIEEKQRLVKLKREELRK